MAAIEKRARELLAAEWERDGYPASARQIREGKAPEVGKAVAAIIAALTPPEGYVLVPVEPTMGMLREAAKHDYYSSKDPTWRDLYQVMLAARPEVPNVND